MDYKPADIPMRFGEFPETMQILVIGGTKGNPLFFDVTNDGYLALEDTPLNTLYYRYDLHLSHSELITDYNSINLQPTFLFMVPKETLAKFVKINS